MQLGEAPRRSVMASLTPCALKISGAALHADTIDPQTARSLLDVGAYFGPVLTTTDVVMAGAVALAALREGVLPRWLGWLSVVFAVEQVAEIFDPRDAGAAVREGMARAS